MRLPASPSGITHHWSKIENVAAWAMSMTRPKTKPDGARGPADGHHPDQDRGAPGRPGRVRGVKVGWQGVLPTKTMAAVIT
jgi:hypothetical protein